MLTPLQSTKVVTSLVYRRRLEEGISELEDVIHEYLDENETNRVSIGGYSISRENGSLIVKEVPLTNVDQLNLPLFVDENTYKLEEGY